MFTCTLVQNTSPGNCSDLYNQAFSKSTCVLDFKFVCIWVFLPTWMSLHYVCSVSGGQQRASDPMELELHTVMTVPMWVLGI